MDRGRIVDLVTLTLTLTEGEELRDSSDDDDGLNLKQEECGVAEIGDRGGA